MSGRGAKLVPARGAEHFTLKRLPIGEYAELMRRIPHTEAAQRVGSDPIDSKGTVAWPPNWKHNHSIHSGSRRLTPIYKNQLLLEKRGAPVALDSRG